MAELYERARPGYPDDAIDYLTSALDLRRGRVVADVAAGTGKLTRRLVESGARVLAVEPLPEMRAQLARLVPDAEVLAGTAEDLPLEEASVDAITVGQAFHWFDPGRAVPEIARVLRPGGALVLLWNMRDLSDPLQVWLDELLRPHRAGTPSEHEQPWRPSLDASPAFDNPHCEAFEWEQPYRRDEFAERIASVSFVAQLPEAKRKTLLEQVRRLADEAGDLFPFRHRTDVYVFPRSRDQAL